MSRRRFKDVQDSAADQRHKAARAAFRELAEELSAAGYCNLSIAHGIQEAVEVHAELVARELEPRRRQVVESTVH